MFIKIPPQTKEQIWAVFIGHCSKLGTRVSPESDPPLVSMRLPRPLTPSEHSWMMRQKLPGRYEDYQLDYVPGGLELSLALTLKPSPEWIRFANTTTRLSSASASASTTT